MKIHLPDTSIMLTSCDRIQSICQWMFDQLGFNFFVYSRHYDTGGTFVLTNDEGDGYHKTWLQRYCAESTWITINELEQLRELNNNPLELIGFFTPEIAVTDVLPTYLKHRSNIDLGQNYGIKKRIYLGFRHKDYIELGGFGGYCYKHEFYNFCIQNLPLLRNFIFYFKQTARDIIEAAIKEAVMIPPHLNTNLSPTHQNFTGYDFFTNRKLSLRLTNQEVACLIKLTQGKTFKETAKILNLSPRTVESYMNNIKNKVGYDNTSELLDVFRTLTQG